MVSKSKFSFDFGDGPHFCSEASHGLNCEHGPTTTLKMLGPLLV